MRDERGEREQLAALVGERGCLLPVGATDIDALLESDRPPPAGVERRMAGGHALHRRPSIAVAVSAGAAGGARLAVPERTALEHPEHARVGGVVVLHRARLAAHEVIARAAGVARELLPEGPRPPRDRPPRDAQAPP